MKQNARFISPENLFYYSINSNLNLILTGISPKKLNLKIEPWTENLTQL